MGMGDIFGDIFSEFFGARGGRSRAAAGEDLRYNLKDLLRGRRFRRLDEDSRSPMGALPDCDGSGARSKDGIITCTNCNGTGQVRMQQGFFSISRTCSRCGGEGRTITEPCPGCRAASGWSGNAPFR